MTRRSLAGSASAFGAVESLVPDFMAAHAPTAATSCCCSANTRQPAAAAPLAPARLARDPARLARRMAAIPGGPFLMGSDDPDAFLDDGEGPVREITLADYQIDTVAVTNRDFAGFVGDTGYVTAAQCCGWSFVFHSMVGARAVGAIREGSVPDAPWWLAVDGACWSAPEGPGSTTTGREEHPVVHVSWRDAAEYAAWAGKSLPTEAQWEKAARGGLARARYPWGDELRPGGAHRCNIWQGRFPTINTGEDGYVGTAPVAAFEPNGYGLYNMAGNVWEWCADWWSATWHADASPATRSDPRGPETGTAKVMRGGSYLCHASYCNRYRVAARTYNSSESSTSHIGFRCAIAGAPD